jgi:hypothetical protein
MDDRVTLTTVELHELIRAAVAENPHAPAAARCHCWKRRMALTVVVMGTCVAVGHIEHIEPLTRGWEFLAACCTDKIIFGVGEL